MPTGNEQPVYIALVSPHGLVRGKNLELGRDADTGGQVKYVLELANALSKLAQVERVDVLTRLVVDPKVSVDYSKPLEEISVGLNIVRIPCGSWRYLKKESLWPHLDSFADNTLKYFRYIGRTPDIFHGHYADGGYVCSYLAGILNAPTIFTGHSLGRIKRERLMAQGMKPETITNTYHIGQRIEAEETTLENSALVIASTSQEVEEQYEVYDNYQPHKMVVIPPGVNLENFSPPLKKSKERSTVEKDILRFLKEPEKPMILALSRPDVRKNISALLKAYGENEKLRELANLVLIIGTRDDIRAMDKGAREVLNEILYLVDYYDLYGNVAYPKKHASDDVPKIYKMAAKSKGVFVNPALTEPFGLTLLESAASGLPVVATENGGAREIVSKLNNGLLIDPLNIESIGEALLSSLTDGQWHKRSRRGVLGTKKHFSWESHAKKYLQVISKAVKKTRRSKMGTANESVRLVTADRAIICDIDDTLIGDSEGLSKLVKMLEGRKGNVAFGVATGRSLKLTAEVLKEWGVPTPDLLITDVGSKIYYGSRCVEDRGWMRHLEYRWNSGLIREVMGEIRGVRLQPKEGQGHSKISYFVDAKKAPKIRDIKKVLRRAGVHAKVVYSHNHYLDILPVRASKGMAIRYLALKWGIPTERILVAGDSGNDEDMLTGNTLGVVVGNYSPELNKLKGAQDVYFASGEYAWGILEAIEHYDFFGKVVSKIEKERVSSI